MLSVCIRAERMKRRRCFCLLLFFLIPVFPAVIGTVNYAQNLGVLSEGWYSLWTQHTLFCSNFFFAPAIAVYCSWLWRLEHAGHNWNRLLTAPVSAAALYFAKFLAAARMTLLLQLLVGLLFAACGKAIGLAGLPPAQIFLWLLRGTLGSAPIIAAQLLLSMELKSFSVPVIAAFLGSIAGMLLNANGLGWFWPYSLMMLGMNANQSGDLLAGSFSAFFLSLAVFTALLCGAGVLLLRRRER